MPHLKAIVSLVYALLIVQATMLVSWSAESLPEGWRSFSPETEEFSINMPPQLVPHAERRDGTTYVSYSATDGQIHYSVFVGGLMGESTRQVEEFENGFVRGALEPIKKQNPNVSLTKEPIRGAGWDGKLMHVLIDNREAAVFVLARGTYSNVAYALVATAPSSNPQVANFIQSFNVNTAKSITAHSGEQKQQNVGYALGYTFGSGLVLLVFVGAIVGGAVLVAKLSKRHKS